VVYDILPKSSVGIVTGIAGFSGAVGGTISAIVIGSILQDTGSYFIIFSMAGSVNIICWLIIKLMIPQIKPLIFYSRTFRL
jgi:MFS transporter, ACS family, hexuronate transporter